MKTSPYRIVLADDHLIVRQGLRRMIEERIDLQVVGEAGDGLELLDLLDNLSADLVILDISMPNLRGIEAAWDGRVPDLKRAGSRKGGGSYGRPGGKPPGGGRKSRPRRRKPKSSPQS